MQPGTTRAPQCAHTLPQLLGIRRVGPLLQGRNLSSYVLDRFPKDQLAALPELFDEMARGIELWLDQGTEAAIPRCNGYRLPGFGVKATD